MGVDLRHGGNRQAVADVLGCRPSQLLDASASLAPWTPRCPRLSEASLRDYPDRDQGSLRQAIAAIHELHPDWVLPGNGAAELFTWAARDASAAGVSGFLAPGFADYRRALQCWDAASVTTPLALSWDHAGPLCHPLLKGAVAWICNPHNPTGQLWSRASLQPLLERYSLVICDEAFLSLVPNGEQHSLIPLVVNHPNLVVIRSLTKLYGIAGLRLGYAVAQPQRLERWAEWRDPWPVNGIALAVGEQFVVIAAALPPLECKRRAALGGHRRCLDARSSLRLCRESPRCPRAVNYLLIRANRSSGAVAGSDGAEAIASFCAIAAPSRVWVRAWLRVGLQSRVVTTAAS